MSFALPIALTLTALALPIVALYILKVRLRRVPVSTNLFWKQIYEEKPPRSIWQQFRHLISLLLQLLFLLLLVLAIADPYFSWQLLQARRLVIVVDNSASMRSTDISPSRLQAAQASAIQIVNGLRFRDEMAIILAGSTPEVVVGMTGHAPTLRDAVDSIGFSDNPTSLGPAVELGRKLIGTHPHGEVIVMTDGGVETVELPGLGIGVDETASPPAESADSKTATDETAVAASEIDSTSELPAKVDAVVAPIEFRIFGSEAGNIGISQLQVRRSLVDPLGYEILASVKNASSVPVNCRLELTLDDIPVDVLPLKLKPEELWSRSLEKTSLEGGTIKAVLTQIAAGSLNEDGASESVGSATTSAALDLLATDNTAWALLPARKTQRVLVVSPGNLFLQKVFEANPLVDVTVQKDFPEQWPSDSIIVLHGAIPAVLPPGNVFVVDGIGDCDQWEQGAVLENPIVTDQDESSSLMTHIRLDNVLVPQARQLQFKTPPHALAKTISDDVIYAEVKRDNGKCLVLSVNLDSSDLAFRTAFPIMVANSLGWFSGTTGELQVSVSTGSVSTMNVSTDDADAARAGVSNDPQQKDSLQGSSQSAEETRRVNASLKAPSGTVEAVPLSVSEDPNNSAFVATFGPLDEIGIWTLSPEKKTVTTAIAGESESQFAEVAVNLASERETDLRPLAQLLESTQSKDASSGWFSRPFWFYLIFIACVLTSIEWFLYHRRFIS